MTLESDIRSAFARLVDKGLLDSGRALLTVRCPSLPPLSANSGTSGEVEISPADANSIECQILDRRPGIGAIIRAQPKWGTLLSQLDRPMPSIFDEQVRQLGPIVETLSESLSEADAKKIAHGETVYLWRQDVMVLGYNLQRAVLNLELFEKCAKSFVLAEMTGQRASQLSWWVRWIAFGRLRRDEKVAAQAFTQGTMPTFRNPY